MLLKFQFILACQFAKISESNWAVRLMQMHFLLNLCTRIWGLKKIPVNNEVAHDMWDSKLVLLRPNFINSRIFNNLETCRPYKMMTQLSTDNCFKTIYQQFLNYYNICWLRLNYMQKWKQEHRNAHSSNPFFSQSVRAISPTFYIQFKVEYQWRSLSLTHGIHGKQLLVLYSRYIVWNEIFLVYMMCTFIGWWTDRVEIRLSLHLYTVFETLGSSQV